MTYGTGLFRTLAEGHYQVAFPEHSIELSVDRLRRERHELHCELSVVCGIIGSRAIDGVLSVGTFNLSSPSAAQQRAKLLAERAHTTGLDWSAMLEELRQRVLHAERTGEPSISLRSVPGASGEVAPHEVLGLALPRHHGTIVFGDGGTGKSVLALRVGVDLVERGERVGYFDWEMDELTQSQRLKRLTGTSDVDIRYVRCERPLIHEIDRLRRVVRNDKLTYAVLDSVGYGTAGAPESAEAAMDYCRAARQLGIGTMWLAHVTKGEQGDQRPFGSTFWFNSARSVWNLKLASSSPDGATHQLAAFDRKQNLGRKRAPVGIEVTHADDAITFTSIDAATIDEIAGSLPMHVRLRGALRDGPMTVAEIAAELNAKPDTVKKALDRGDKLFTRVLGQPDGIHRWALLERRVA